MVLKLFFCLPYVRIIYIRYFDGITSLHLFAR